MFTELRKRAKAGDSDAAAIIAKQRAAEIASKAKALANGKNHNAESKRRMREKSQENKRKGAAGNPVAQAAYEKYRDQKKAESTRKARRSGVKPLAEHLAAITLPPEVKQAKKQAKSKEFYKKNREAIEQARRQIIDLAKAGDPVAKAAYEKRLAQARESGARFRAKARMAVA